ncbi:uncharacterized protein LOC121595545 [Anopheles merus]|uniref:uncharacterized protein LOC121595545 n=1 Tax=Anopheles merus TaxID=30066 RepID=UPI001BE448C6|nr:uncharacterized protein LOC121595545 [Anopheles merus]
MWILLFSFLLTAVSLHGIQIDFERFEQLSGFNLYNSSLRVRKFNRTLVTLNGTLEIVAPLNKTIMVSTDFFHSSRGNQQYNHHPAKFPTRDVCDFMSNFYEGYNEHVEDIINMPKRGECPITPRMIYVVNKNFPAKAVPHFFRPGLWKAYMINKIKNVEVSRFEMLTGFDVYGSTLRVRKYNRTTIVLNGTFTSKIVLDNKYVVSTQLFHSPLGNQQFNHYPMKLPTHQLCDFVDMLHDEYGEYLVNVYNMPERGSVIIPIDMADINVTEHVIVTV